jgi:hypothetical protein
MTDRVHRLIEAGRRASERADGERREAAAAGPAPRPGDLYALPATTAYDVEWLVVAAVSGGRWLLLAADLAGTGGGADVEVPAGEPGGPLTVYGRFPVTVPGSLLPAALRGGRLSEERRAEAERRWRDLAAGTEPAALDVDFDPGYRRRVAELAAAQRALAEAAAAAEEGGDPGGGPGGGAPGPHRGPATVAHEDLPGPVPILRPTPGRLRPPPWLTALAAVLALAVVALAGLSFSLLRQVERQTGARQVQLGPVVTVGEVERGVVELSPGERVGVTLRWDDLIEEGERFRLDLVAPDGREVLDSTLVESDSMGFAYLDLPGDKVLPGVQLRLYRVGDEAPPEPVLELMIQVADP